MKPRVGQSLIRSFANRSFPLFSKERLLAKGANEQSLFSSLFAKERMSNRSFDKSK